MNNMYAGEPDKGIFNIRYDFDKSHGSYIFDKNTKSPILISLVCFHLSPSDIIIRYLITMTFLMR